MQLSVLAVAVVAELAERVLLSFQVGTGDVVEEQGGGSSAPGEIVAPQFGLEFFLPGGKIVERSVEVVFIEAGQAEHCGDGVIARPPDGGDARALMGDASKDQEIGRACRSGCDRERQ